MIQIKKYIFLVVMLMFLAATSVVQAETDDINVVSSGNDIIISGVVSGAPAYSEVGITLFESGAETNDYSYINGELPGVILSMQKTLDSDCSFSLPVDISALPFGDIIIRVGSVYLDLPMEDSFKIIKVSVSGNMKDCSDKYGDYKLLCGESFTIKLSATEQVPLKHLKINGVTKLADISAEASYTTEDLFEDTTVVYRFYGGSTDIKNLASSEKYIFSDLKGNILPEERWKIKDKAVAILSASADEFYNDYTRVEAGYIFSLDAGELNNSPEICEKIVAREISDKNTFAVMFFADPSYKGKSFVARAYAVYKNDDGDVFKAYGGIKSFVLSEFEQTVHMESVLLYNNLNPSGIKIYELGKEDNK